MDICQSFAPRSARYGFTGKESDGNHPARDESLGAGFDM